MFFGLEAHNMFAGCSTQPDRHDSAARRGGGCVPMSWQYGAVDNGGHVAGSSDQVVCDSQAGVGVWGAGSTIGHKSWNRGVSFSGLPLPSTQTIPLLELMGFRVWARLPYTRTIPPPDRPSLPPLRLL